MGRVFKFAKTELQYSGATAKPKFMYIDFLPEQDGELVYNGEEQFPTWKNLDPLKLLIEGEKSATNAGVHYITVTPMGNFAWPDNTQTPKEIPYTIKRKPLSAIPSQKSALTFNKSQQTPAWNNYNPAELDIGGTYQNQINAGKYKATFTPNSNHCWSDGTYAAKEVEWSIGILKLAKPTAVMDSYEYTGSPITLAVSNYNSNYMTQSGTASATNIGSNYKATYTLNSTTNTTWSDGTTAAVNLPWRIDKAPIYTIPTIQFVGVNYFDDPNGTARVQTPGEKINALDYVYGYDSNTMTVSGTTEASTPGNYTMTFAPDANHYFYGLSGNCTLTWKLKKKRYSYPYIYNTQYTYGTTITFTDSDYRAFDSTLMEAQNAPAWSRPDAGEHEVKFVFKNQYKDYCVFGYDNSSEKDSVTSTYTVNRKPIAVPTWDTSTSSLAKTGTYSAVYNLYNSSDYALMSALLNFEGEAWTDGIDKSKCQNLDLATSTPGTYNCVIALSSNYCWPNGGTGNLTYTLTVRKDY